MRWAKAIPERPETPSAPSNLVGAGALNGSSWIAAKPGGPAPVADITGPLDACMWPPFVGWTDVLREEIDAGVHYTRRWTRDTALNVHVGCIIARCGRGPGSGGWHGGRNQQRLAPSVRSGHHACRDKAMGFVFNNVAIAARYALSGGLKRVAAIMDFDVHHGNGTENIVGGDQRILMVSFFQHPVLPARRLASTASNLVNVPAPSTPTVHDVRDIVNNHWLPRLEAYRPAGSCSVPGLTPTAPTTWASMGLVESDYAWITERIQGRAAAPRPGRIVSLPGGGTTWMRWRKRGSAPAGAGGGDGYRRFRRLVAGIYAANGAGGAGDAGGVCGLLGSDGGFVALAGFARRSLHLAGQARGRWRAVPFCCWCAYVARESSAVCVAGGVQGGSAGSGVAAGDPRRVKVLQVVFAQARWARLVEHTISWVAWLAMVLWVSGLLPVV